jgi:pimeloyl-ACP methyl ester carboxylesterase
VTEHFFDARGACYRTNVFQPGRHTLVFVHGVSGSSSAWRPYESRFEPRLNVLTYDLRGHGKSFKPPRYRDYAISCFVDDLDALLAHLDIDRCVIVCHSFAVLMVLAFLRQYPGRVKGVVLVSGEFDPARHLPARLLKYALAPVPWLERLPLRWKPGTHIDYARYAGTGDWNVSRMLADIGNTSWRVYLYCTRQALAVRETATLSRIAVPVRLIHGRRDTIFSVRNSIEMAALIPNADLTLVDSDHILVLNRPREVGDAIEDFLSRVPVAPSPSRSLRLVTQAPAAVDERDEHRASRHIPDQPYRH